MSVHIALMGRTKEPVLEGLWKHGSLMHGEVFKLFILHSRNSETFPFENYARDLAKTLVEAGFPNIELIVIDAFNMYNIIETIHNIAEVEPRREIFVNITGGTNLMAAAACIAAFIIGARAYYVLDTRLIDSDTSPILELPLPNIPPLKSLQGHQLEILRYLKLRDGRSSNVDLRAEIDVSPQVLSYHIKSLEKMRLITTKKGWTTKIQRGQDVIQKTDSRALCIELTMAGKLAANVVT